MMIKDQITSSIEQITGLKDVTLEVPVREEHGDFSTNIAMQMFSHLKKEKSDVKVGDQSISTNDVKSPKRLAELVVEVLTKNPDLSKFVRKIEAVEPGFINFWLSEEVLFEELKEVVQQGPQYGMSKNYKGKKIMFEFGQPNTHKLPHIGHLFSFIFGESASRILEAAGAEVYRANYQGDIGPHVAKCLWALKKEDPDIPKSLEEKVKLLQKMYQIGSKAYNESENAKIEIDEINKLIYQKDESIFDLWQDTRQWSIDYYKQFEERLGINYDRHYFESEVFEKGKQIVEELTGKVFTKSEGALIFEGSKHGLHDRVFVTRIDTPTYEAKDMYLQVLKLKEWPADLLIISTASEQNEYFKVVFKALEEFDKKFADKLKHIGFGMVQLKEGKMASREGKIIGAVDLIDLTVQEIEKIVEDREDLSEQEKKEIAQKVGQAAVKYSFLKSNPLQDMVFDLKESINLEGNSGPYLQYTYARTQSVLRKVQIENREQGTGDKEQRTENKEQGTKKSVNNEELLLRGVAGNEAISVEEIATLTEFARDDKSLEIEEESLLRSFVHFQSVIVEAAYNYSPNLLANYLYELAQKYNSFYNKHRILEDVDGGTGIVDGDGEKPQYTNHNTTTTVLRIALTAATGQILKNGLKLLGIQAPMKM